METNSDHNVGLEIETGAGPLSDPCRVLSDALLAQVLPEMRVLREKCDEICRSQNVMIDSMQQENEKASQWNPNAEFETFIEEVKYYRGKLRTIRKTMLSVTEKCNKMKRRAEKLRDKREREDLKEEERKRKLEEAERRLMAKNASSSDR